MAKDHGSSVKNDKQYEGLRKKGMQQQELGLGQWRQPRAEGRGRPQGRQEVELTA
jgi:hypothetical protein